MVGLKDAQREVASGIRQATGEIVPELKDVDNKIILKWYDGVRDIYNKANEYIKENTCEKGYFTIVQYDDGPLLKLPENTMIYGACSGKIPIPLIYQDTDNKLATFKQSLTQSQPSHNRDILCSFIGTNTHICRGKMYNILSNKPGFILNDTGGWNPCVIKSRQDNFINNTLKSKFGLAPRGYGRGSFRFYEIIQLGTIPIYIWDDIEWLPYKSLIDYSQFAISINISNLDQLPSILNDIINTGKYETMIENLEKNPNAIRPEHFRQEI